MQQETLFTHKSWKGYQAAAGEGTVTHDYAALGAS